jgi:hypothetical protein
MRIDMKSSGWSTTAILFLSGVGLTSAESIDLAWDMGILDCNLLGGGDVACQFLQVTIYGILIFR